MDLPKALEWATSRSHAVLITIRADGRPQSSDVVYACSAGHFTVSVTDERAKTANMRRDPRVVLHVTDPDAWEYVAFDGTASLSPVATAPDDSTCDALVEYYEQVQGASHPDWDEYRAAMVEQARLVATITPTSAVGQVR
jgi:PPOX class probable F420-dependent enzyme